MIVGDSIDLLRGRQSPWHQCTDWTMDIFHRKLPFVRTKYLKGALPILCTTSNYFDWIGDSWRLEDLSGGHRSCGMSHLWLDSVFTFILCLLLLAVLCVRSAGICIVARGTCIPVFSLKYWIFDLTLQFKTVTSYLLLLGLCGCRNKHAHG